MRNSAIQNRVQAYKNFMDVRGADRFMNRGPDHPDTSKFGMEGTANRENEKQLRKAAQKFESLFINMLMKQMRETLPDSKVLSGGQGENVFQSMLDSKIASKASETEAGIGIADMVFDELKSSVNRTLNKLNQSGVNPENGGGRQGK